MTVWRFNPAAADGVVLGGGAAFAIRVGGVALAGRAGGGAVSTDEPPNENGTVVAPVPADGGGGGALRTGLSDDLVGATAAALAPTNLAALSSGRDAVSLDIGAGGVALTRVRATGAAAGTGATCVPASADATGWRCVGM